MSDEPTNPRGRRITEEIGERVITGEYKIVPASEVSLNQRQSNGKGNGISGWVKIVAAIGATFGAVQAFNSLGPCNTGWRFQTTEAAQVESRNNSEEHVAIRENIGGIASDVKDIQTAVSRIERKLGTRR